MLQQGGDSGSAALPESQTVTLITPANEISPAESAGAHDAASPIPTPPTQGLLDVDDSDGDVELGVLLMEDEWCAGLLTHLRRWDSGDGPAGARVGSRRL